MSKVQGVERVQRSERADVHVKQAQIDRTGLRVLSMSVAEADGAGAVVRWLAARTAIDRRGVLRWHAFDATSLARLKEVAAGAMPLEIEVTSGVEGLAVEGRSCDLIDATGRMGGADTQEERLGEVWEAVAPGGVLIAVVPLLDMETGPALYARVANALQRAGVDVADALVCVIEGAPDLVVEVTRL